MSHISYEDFDKVDIRIGNITEVKDFPEARKSCYKLTIDFGEEVGIKKSAAQITKLYKKEDLIGKQVIAVVNFPPRQIGPFISEVLTLGVPDENNQTILVVPEKSEAVVGGKLF